MKRIIFLLIILISVNHVSAQDHNVLTLGLYPHVPDLSRFKSVISEKWKQRHPEVLLEFSDWDCYSGTLPEKADVFVYDAVYMNDYLKQGLLLPLTKSDIKDIDDFFPFVMDVCSVEDEFYAVPEFLCSEFLYTRKSDTELNDIENIRELYEVIGELDLNEGLLPLNEGLLVSIPSKLNASFWLVQALVDAEQAELSVLFPLDPDKIPKEASDSLWMIREMAGFEDMTLNTENNGPYIFGEWFTDGVGRAYIGFSEAMSVMGDSTEDLDFRLYSMTEDKNIPLFYADLASVNAKINEEKRALAIELLNLITGTEVFVRASSPIEPDQSYQYLLSARESVYKELGKSDPIYTELETYVSDPYNRLFMVRNEDLSSLYETSLITSLLQQNRMEMKSTYEYN